MRNAPSIEVRAERLNMTATYAVTSVATPCALLIQAGFGAEDIFESSAATMWARRGCGMRCGKGSDVGFCRRCSGKYAGAGVVAGVCGDEKRFSFRGRGRAGCRDTRRAEISR